MCFSEAVTLTIDLWPWKMGIIANVCAKFDNNMSYAFSFIANIHAIHMAGGGWLRHETIISTDPDKGDTVIYTSL